VATATVHTSHGEFSFELDESASPKAVASFAKLARKGFFDGTVFHRIVPDFVIQGGDPTGTGTGGPGYSTVDPPDGATTYGRGVVAMAKTASDPPGTAGSQFFVVTADDAGLPPEYAVIGRVTDGLDVVLAIGELGDAGQKPTERVVVEELTVGTAGETSVGETG
jgi:cyclophilin family peptidyl-prolyl cis-trans isomerase